MQKRKQIGFTIVELLIVIVVIAILAAISIVAYNGIQNRSYDSAVRSDLSNFEKLIKLRIADSDEIPPGGSFDGSASNPPYAGMTIKLSREAYFTGTHNVSYCRGTDTATGQVAWAISVKSRSGNVFLYNSLNGSTSRGNVGHASTSACSAMQTGYTYSYGYNTTTNTWFSWTA